MVEDNWTAAKTKHHIYFNGQLIATHDQADSVRMLFKDNLGSTRSVAKVFLPAGSESWGTTWQVVEVHDWEPYGNLYSAYGDDPADRVTQKFTGQKRDSETGLDYFGARYYDAGVGASPGNPRWISADPLTERVFDPPYLNKYSYVRTDPINFVDPDGRMIGPPMWVITGFPSVYFFDPPASHSYEPQEISGFQWATGYYKFDDQKWDDCRKQYKGQIPELPPGADLKSNIETAMNWSLRGSSGFGRLIARVAPQGTWDYKLMDENTRRYEPAGNFNFGAVFAAFGIPHGIAQSGALVVQWLTTNFQYLESSHKTLLLTLLKESEDSKYIKDGYEFHKYMVDCTGGAKFYPE